MGCIWGAIHDNFPWFLVFGFRRKLAPTKLNKAQTKWENITCIQYTLRISTGNGFNFMLYFLLLSICANPQLPPPPHNPLLKHRVQYDSQDTVTASTILRSIRWAGHFFVGISYVWDIEWDIWSATIILLSRTQLTFSLTVQLCLTSRIYVAVVLIVLLLWCRTRSTPPPPYGVSFVVLIVLPLLHISSTDVLISPRPWHLLHCCTYLPLLSSCVFDVAILINLHTFLPYLYLVTLHLHFCHPKIFTASVLI